MDGRKDRISLAVQTFLAIIRPVVWAMPWSCSARAAFELTRWILALLYDYVRSKMYALKRKKKELTDFRLQAASSFYQSGIYSGEKLLRFLATSVWRKNCF